MNLSISASGMVNAAERQQLTANNLANINTPGYQAAQAVNTETAEGGVRMTAVTRDPSPGPLMPSTDGSAKEGSNVSMVREQVGNIMNPRQMEASAAALRTQDEMLGTLLDLSG